MKSFNTHLLGAAMGAIIASPTLAADYSPPIFVEKMPEYVSVEVGTGWYLRGDISYNLNRPTYEFDLLGRSTDNLRFGGGVGLGYQLTDFLRSDVTLNFIAKDRFNISDGINSVSASHSLWTGMFNTYVDLGTVVGITPYIGGGIGVAHTRHDVSVDIPPLGFDWKDRQNRFAYSLAAGVAYRMTDNTSLDVGYQFLHSPGTRYLDTDDLTIQRGIKHHQLRVGLRYALW